MKVLDHGYVNLVESWGSDERIIEAARMSTQKGFEGWDPHERCVNCGCLRDGYELTDREMCTHRSDLGRGPEQRHVWEQKTGDLKLLRYLWKNNHATPFEMGGAVLEVQAPIFVFREWLRHRTQSYNEMSARYAPLPDLNYVPTVERLMLGGGHLTKQAAGTGATLTLELAEWFRANLEKSYKSAESLYQIALQDGTPKELARLILPVGRYSRLRASANLRNWLGFLTLRLAPQAQWEIRQYAQAVHEVLAPLFPRTIGLFDEARTPVPHQSEEQETKR